MQLNLGNPIALVGFASYAANVALLSAGKKLVKYGQGNTSCTLKTAKVAGHTLEIAGKVLLPLSLLIAAYGTAEVCKWYSNNRHLFSIVSLLTQGGGAVATVGIASFFAGLLMMKGGKDLLNNLNARAKTPTRTSICRALSQHFASWTLTNLGRALSTASIVAVGGGLFASNAHYLYPFAQLLMKEGILATATKILAYPDKKAALMFTAIIASSTVAGCMIPAKMHARLSQQ